MREFLQPGNKREYPTDYLLARLQGRKTYIVKNWDNILMHANPEELLLDTHYREFISAYSLEGIWKRALKEFNWVYHQMNSGITKIFKSFYIYLELRTLMIFLRHRLSEPHGSLAQDILSYSLLSDKVKKILIEGPEVQSIISQLEKTILSAHLKDSKLSETFTGNGLKGPEERITSGVLEYILSSELHPVMDRFFKYLADSRNIIAVCKHLKWNITETPVLVHGETIRESVLLKVLKERQVPVLISLAGKLAKTNITELNPAKIENVFLKEATRRVGDVKLLSDIGFILHYLWSIYIEAWNLGIILYGREIEKDVLKEELVV